MEDGNGDEKKKLKKRIKNDFSLLERLKLETNLAMNEGQPGANRFDSKAEHFEKGQPREAKTGMEVLVIEDKANDGWHEKRHDTNSEYNQVQFFHTADNEPYVTFDADGISKTFPVRSKDFNLWLRLLLYRRGLITLDSVRDIVRRCEAMALFEGPQKNVYIRFAEADGAVYFDMANDAWEQIKITSQGWKIIQPLESPVKFERANGMQPLCYPGSKKASMEMISRFFNVKSEHDLVLIVSWLIGAMQPSGPFPILVLQGEQGSAKSTTAKLLKDLLDPASVPLRTLPYSNRDLAIAASKSWIQCIDNLSGLPVWLSDAFCRLATGGGFGTRALFTNDTEFLFNACRPTILNGISDIATRHDLADRSLIVHLPPISEKNRMSEREMWSAWHRSKPSILRMLIDSVSAALRNLHDVKLSVLPRMADFAKWVTAAEIDLGWTKGTFIKAYETNRMNLVDIALEADIVATAILALMQEAEEWSGTPSELYEDLKRKVPEYERKSNAWPRGANVLSGRLVRAQTFLRKKGIEIERSKSGIRNITIRRIGGKAAEPGEELIPQPAVQPESQGGLKEVSAEECERFDFPVKPATITEHGPAMEPSIENDDIVEGEI